MKIEFRYYRYSSPGFPLNDWEYQSAKNLSSANKKIDFFGMPSVYKAFKEWLLINAVVLGILILLAIKVYFLPTDGAEKTLNFVEYVYLVVFIVSFLPLSSLTIVLIRAKYYNLRLNRLLKKSIHYQDFQNRYFNK